MQKISQISLLLTFIFPPSDENLYRDYSQKIYAGQVFSERADGLFLLWRNSAEKVITNLSLRRKYSRLYFSLEEEE